MFCVMQDIVLNIDVNVFQINWQSLEDTQVGYVPQKYTLNKHTLEKYT